MKIILMRHGRPLIHLDSMRSQRKTPTETGKIIRDYKLSDLDPHQSPPQSSIDIANASGQIFSSNLPRAISSVTMLGYADNVIIDPNFRESDHPYYESNFPKLKFFTWCIIFRLMWFCGFSKNGESIKIGRQRAQFCAELLINSAQDFQSSLSLGHGIMNRLISAKLKKQGWRQTSSNGNNYWSFIVLEKN